MQQDDKDSTARKIRQIFYDRDTLYLLSASSEQTFIETWENDRREIRFCFPSAPGSRLYGYGGQSVWLKNNELLWIDKLSGQIYFAENFQNPQRLTDSPDSFFGDLDTWENFVIAVEEQESLESSSRLVLWDKSNRTSRILAEDADFFSNPRFSPDGSSIARIQWNFPDMPWDANELKITEIQNGKIQNERTPAGGKNESVFQPEWNKNGDLIFANDPEGWWNLYQFSGNQISPVFKEEVECGKPAWVSGMQTHRPLCSSRILYTFAKNGFWHLRLANTRKNTQLPCETVFAEIDNIVGDKHRAFILGALPGETTEVFRIDPQATKLEPKKIPQFSSQPRKTDSGKNETSQPERLQFFREDGPILSGFYFPPAFSDQNVSDKKFPVVFKVHGGPTGSTSSKWKPEAVFFNSRGFGYFDLDYSGSSGFGREFREKLYGGWGETDVADYLDLLPLFLKKIDADPQNIFLRGSSAGGFTVLRILSETNRFRAAACYYGITDFAELAEKIPKFESGYDRKLFGKKELERKYHRFSAIHFPEKIQSPVIFFHGGKDRIVPLNQSQKMHTKLKEFFPESQLVEYPEEGHGFSDSVNIQDALEKELDFYLSQMRTKSPAN